MPAIVERLTGPTVYREASAVSAAVLDETQRRVRLSFSSEEPYLRASYFDDPWNETLGHNPDEVDLSRLNNGAPLLFGHDAHDRDALVGIVERAWLENGRGYADVRLSGRDDIAGLWHDVSTGIVRNVSVGYQIQERTLVRQNNQGPSDYRVTRWLPMEISLVPIPADATVGIGRAAEGSQRYTIQALNNEDTVMPEAIRSDQPSATPPVDNTAAISAARAEGARIEHQRQSAIRNAVRAGNLPDDFAQGLIDNPAIDANQAREQVLDELMRRSAASPTDTTIRATGGRDLSREASIVGMQDAILLRMQPTAKVGEQCREFRSLRMIEMARHALAQFNGARSVHLLSPVEVATQFLRAHSTSDFPNLLGNVANKRLRAQYDENQPTYIRWARRAPNAPDFKSIDVTQLSGNPNLQVMIEGEDYTYGSLSDGKETYRVATYGKGLGLTRQAIVNDDLRAFDRILSGFAASARRLENATVYGELLNNANLADGVALFAAGHGGNALTAAAISVASLTLGRAVMRKQTGLAGEALNIAPSFLICGPDKEQEAYQYTSANYVPATAGTINEFRAGGRTALEPIVDALVTGNKWFLAANSADVDTVEYCYLDGAEGVVVESQADFDSDQLKFKARLDFAAKAIDYRGLAYNSGL